jgi:hypothetical protein
MGGGGWLSSTMAATARAISRRMPTKAPMIAPGLPRDACGCGGAK